MTASADPTDVMPQRSNAVEVADFATEFVVFDPRSLMAHHLSGWLAVVFDACDGTSSCSELADDATQYWRGDRDDARHRIGEAIRTFENLGILAGFEAMKPPPCIGCGAAEIAPRRRWPSRR